MDMLIILVVVMVSQAVTCAPYLPDFTLKKPFIYLFG